MQGFTSGGELVTGQHWQQPLHDPGGREGGGAGGEAQAAASATAMEVQSIHAGSADPTATGRRKRWALSVQPPGKRRAGCRACREPLSGGEVRFTPAGKVSCRSWYYHQGCINDCAAKDPLNLEGFRDLTAEQQSSLELLIPAATSATAAAPMAESEEEEERRADEGYETNKLRNMEFWESFDWSGAQQRQINTMIEIPKQMRHTVMEAKAAVLEVASTGADTPESRQAWRLLCVFDRLLLCRPASGEKKWNVTDKVGALAERLRLFWRGSWQEMWDSAAEDAGTTMSASRHQLSREQKAVKIEALIDADELGKALKTVLQTGPPNTDPCRLIDLRALFPKSSGADGIQSRIASWDVETEERVEESIAKLLLRLPRGTGAGIDASRYEHWGGNDMGEIHIKAAAKCMRLWVQGLAPDFAYNEMRQGRILALDKKDGGLRPLVLCTVFRRIALRGMLAAFKDDLAGMVGESQYALGQPGGDVLLVRLLEAAVSTGKEAVLSIDIKNAFGTMSRAWIDEAMAKHAPQLVHILPLLYDGPSKHKWTAEGQTFEIEAFTGVDQGCPFSMLAFMIGLKVIQDNVSKHLRETGVDVLMGSYADDTYIAAPADKLDFIEQVWKIQARHAGMTLADRKKVVWCPNAREKLSQCMVAVCVDSLPVLGHTAEREDLLVDRAGLGELSDTAWARSSSRLDVILTELTNLTHAGLSKQSAQAILRVWAASIPQHVMRGSLVRDDLLKNMDGKLEEWWAKLLAEQSMPQLSRQQLHLPLNMGGAALGGLQMRGPAAYLAGAMQTHGVIAKKVGLSTLEQLHHAMPALHLDAEAAAQRLEDFGVKGDLKGWLRGKRCNAKGAQKRWMRQALESLQGKLLKNGPAPQVLGIRSGGGAGAGGFLQAPRNIEDRVADQHFVASMRSRLGLSLSPAAGLTQQGGTAPQCQHRPRKGGPCCGALLDADGMHAAHCEVGGHVLDRHDDTVSLLARKLRDDCGSIVGVEQRRPELDYRNDQGDVVEARMDLVVTLQGKICLLDVTYADVRTADAGRLAARLRRDGAAARMAEDRKRRRYGASVIPIVFESGGRLGEAGRRWLKKAYRAAGAQAEWPALMRALSAQVQASTAAIVIAAVAGA